MSFDDTIYFLVLDCGGVSTDLAVIESKKGSFRNIAIVGNDEVGLFI